MKKLVLFMILLLSLLVRLYEIPAIPLSLQNGGEFVENMGARTQRGRLFYNSQTNEYRYISSHQVYCPGVIEGTNWVTQEEFPIRFVIRLMNGSIQKFNTSSEVITYIGKIDNSTLWGVGIETYEGVLGLFLNFQNEDWGHGQYIFWPRLKNGSITAYNYPLYAIYSHLYAKVGSNWYDAILNNRNLYTPTQNPKNHLVFSDFSISFLVEDLSILSSTWDVKMGLKWNNNQFHFISEITCVSRSLDDVGFAYEITSSPQSDGTPYQPNEFVISNDTKEITVGIQEAWEAGVYLENFYSRIVIRSQNNLQFTFNFTDMTTAGFTQKYLNLHNQTFPDGSWRYTLRAGMFDYGAYTQGTWVYIDPTTSSEIAASNDDADYLYDYNDIPRDSPEYCTTRYLTVGSMQGRNATAAWQRWGYMRFELNIAQGATITEAIVHGYETYDGDPAGTTPHITRLNVTNCLSFDNYAVGSAPAANYTNQVQWSSDGGDQLSWYNVTVTDMVQDHINLGDWSSGNYMGFRLGICPQDNYQYWWEAYDNAASNEAYINITYSAGENNAPDTPVLHSDSGNTFGGKSFTIGTNHSDSDGAADIETMYLSQYYSGYNVTIYCFQNTSSGSVTILTGSDYLDGTPTYSHSSSGNTITVIWTIVFDWDYIDDTAYTTYARTVDDEPEWSSWGNLDSDNLFENDLEVTYFDLEINDSSGITGGDVYLNDTEWFRGGLEVNVTYGIVEYQGSSEKFNSSYAAAVDIELYYDSGATGEKDTVILTGVFASITYTPTSASGLDTTAYFDVVINDIPTGGSDVTASGVEITSKRDNENPSVSVSTDADSNSGTGYDPNTNYDDDSTIDFTASGGSDGSGAGLHATPYSWNYTAWTSSTTKQYTGESDGNHSVFLDVRDAVGNNGTTQEAWVVVDTDDPTGFTYTWARVNSTYPFQVYDLNMSIYFDPGSECNNYSTLTINDDGTIQNSGFWKVEWDKNSVFETAANDTSGLPDSKNFYYQGDTNGTFLVRIVNNAGNFQTISNYTAIDTLDSGCGVPPTTTTTTTTSTTFTWSHTHTTGGVAMKDPPNPYRYFYYPLITSFGDIFLVGLLALCLGVVIYALKRFIQ